MVQILLKQGQVELEAENFPEDYSDSLLLHRNVVEDLNDTIKVHRLIIITLFPSLAMTKSLSINFS